MRRIGVVVNPIAGMGGRVGLKGTDGKVEEARDLGAEPRAPQRAVEALEVLREHASQVEVITYGGVMGEDECLEAGLKPEVVGEPRTEETTAEDTRDAVRRFVEEDVDLILFVGGDGTAVDVAETLETLNDDTPILGVPAGVKIYSSVFAVRPSEAGRIGATFDSVEKREVNDLDEEAYREGEVRARLRGVVNVPVDDDLQSSKELGRGDVKGIAEGFVDDVEDGVTYVLGPGSTVGAIKEELGFEGTPLGVDVWRPGPGLIAKDANEDGILENLGERNVVVVSPIGGQGFIFGRGNQQISPEVISRSEVVVIASRDKLNGVEALRVDTGDEDTDERLRGWMKVRTGRSEKRLMKVE